MRNLKRVLSLALATVMLLGMMVIGAGAADAKKTAITDLDKAVNKEAVTLMVDLKIIEGKPDGTFDPTGIVDRATMAKLITMIMMGDVDQNSFKGATTDLTDINGNWAEGYIKFCYSNKIISGDGQGHFNPSQPVTTAAAAKMLLVALGYVASDRGYEGASWSLNVMRDAQSTSELTVDNKVAPRPLTKGASVKSNDPLTRDNAAQMIFNTLFARTQDPIYQWDGGKQYIQKYDPKSAMAVTTYGGLTRYTGTLTSIADGYAKATVSDGAAVSPSTITLSNVSNKVAANATSIGGKIVVYADSAKKLVSTTATNAAATVLATSTKGTTYANLTTKGKTGYIGFEPDASISLYVNGTKQTTDTGSDGGYVIGTDDAAITTIGTANDDIGKVIEFIDNDDSGKYDVVKFTTYTMSKVTAVAAEKANGTEATVTIKNVKFDASAGITENAATVAVPKSAVVGNFADLAKDDYVMYAIMGTGAGNRLYVYEPEVVTGKMTSYNTSKKTITVDGTVYTTAQTPNQTTLTLATATTATGVDSNFYMDANGYAVVTNAVSLKKTVGVVLARNLVQKNALGTAPKNSITIAREDGTVATYEYAGLDDMSSTAFSGLLTTLGGSTDGATLGHPIQFTLNADGEMTSATEVTTASLTTALAKDQTTLPGPSAAGKYMTSDTIFMYVTSTTGTYTFNTFTGIANIVPDTTAVRNFVADGNKITHVVAIADASAAATTGKDVAYALATGGESDGTYTTGSFAVAGELTALKTAVGGTAGTKGLVYTYNTTNKGVTTLTAIADYANKVSALKATAYFKAVVKLVDGKFVVVTPDTTTFGATTETVVKLATDVKIYDITTGDAVSAGTLAADQEVTIVVNTADTWTTFSASAIFITK